MAPYTPPHATAEPESGRSPRERLAAVDTWALALGDRALKGDLRRRYADYDLLVLDGQEARTGQVAALREEGTIVLAYISVGTIEPWRPWYRRAKPYRLDRWDDWDEYFAKVSAPGFRRLIRGVAAGMLDKGFDGLFLDNTAMVEDHPRQAKGMTQLVKALSQLVRPAGRLLFTQNGERVIGPTLRYYDGWSREDVTSTYSFSRRRYVRQPAAERRSAQATLRRIARAGLFVTATDYTARGDSSTERLAVSTACAAGALPFVSDIGLNRVPPEPPGCDAGR